MKLVAPTALVVLLAACGGGGGAGTSPVAKTPSTPAKGTSTPAPAAAARQSVGTASLTLKLPAAVTAKNGKAIQAVKGLKSSSRGPAYVNPTANTVLDIYVDGTLIPNIDNSVGSNDSLYVQSTTDGTQNVTLPLYSTSTNNIVAVEWDGTDHYGVLAVGETDQGSFSPGSTLTLTMTLQMNAAYVGILDLYNQSDPEVMFGQSYNGLSGSPCGGPSTQSQFGLYAADYLGTFVPVAGYGGTANPALGTISPDSGGTSTVVQTTIPGIYAVSWDNSCDGVTLNASVANPVQTAFADTVNFGAGSSSYGYYYCAIYGGGYCPGGPHQGLWDWYWGYDGYPGGAPQASFYSSTITGSVDFFNGG